MHRALHRPTHRRRPAAPGAGDVGRSARRRTVALAVLATAALGGGARALPSRMAAAHGETVTSEPAAGAVVAAPTEVSIRFTAPLAPASKIDVVDAAFASAVAGPTRIDDQDGFTMRVPLRPALADGAYSVAWTAIDAGDGHTTTGSFTFRVGPDAGRGQGGWLAVVIGAATVLAGAAFVVTRRGRRSAAGAAAVLAAAIVAAGCASPAGDAPAGDAPAAESTAPSSVDAPAPGGAATGAVAPGPSAAAAGVPIQVAIAASDMAVGEERFAFAILDTGGTLIPGATLTATFFRLEGEAAEETGTVPATFYPSQLADAGTYVALTRFDRAGPWGVAIGGQLPDGRAVEPNRVRFEVATRPRSPAVGDKAPPTSNRTTAGGTPLAELTSDPTPDPALYALTVDQAIASGKPTVVLFATPGYCQSRICTPVMDEVKAVARDWQGRVHVIHIEVYKTFDPLVLTDEMAAWGLETEPWTFVLRGDGTVAARLEGNATRAEIEPILARLVGDG